VHTPCYSCNDEQSLIGNDWSISLMQLCVFAYWDCVVSGDQLDLVISGSKSPFKNDEAITIIIILCG